MGVPFFRYFFLSIAMLIALVVGWAGFRGSPTTKPPLEIFPDMDDQAKVKAQDTSEFFADGQGARAPIPGAIPAGIEATATRLSDKTLTFTAGGTDYYHTGRFGDYYGDGLPEQVEVSAALIRRGNDRYNIYCAVCHGYAGDGGGITGKFGLPAIANLHLASFADPKDPAYRTDGNIFNTITWGKGQMGPYPMIPVDDRWAIVAYVRALQLAKATPAVAATPVAPAPAAPATPAAK
jgi:mono/diheme cytochrome c family protein